MADEEEGFSAPKWRAELPHFQWRSSQASDSCAPACSVRDWQAGHAERIGLATITEMGRVSHFVAPPDFRIEDSLACNRRKADIHVKIVCSAESLAERSALFCYRAVNEFPLSVSFVYPFLEFEKDMSHRLAPVSALALSASAL